MADNKVFVSPGVFTSERDLTFVAQQVGVTTLGLVGETVKGPAFEPIFITDYEEFVAIFGGQNPAKFGDNKPKYELPYIAKSYLTESNQLFITRILGLTGYDAGSAWMITVDANYDPDTIASATTGTWTATFTGTTYGSISDPNAQYLYDLGLFPNGPTLTSSVVPSDTTTYPEGIVFDKTTGGSFTGTSLTITQTSLSGTSGTVSGTVSTWTATEYTEYEGMVLAMLRSRADYSSDTLEWRTDPSSGGVVLNAGNATTNPEAQFVLSATTSGGSSVVTYDVSLDTGSRNYITRVLGTDCFDKDGLIFVEEHYPNLLEKLIDNNYIRGINSTLAYTTSFENYKQPYQTPETPWVVSELRGNIVDKLFKLISISDGSAANKEIKISIQNIKPDTKEFDVIVREFNDTDRRPSIIESFRKCVMDPQSDRYLPRIIGTADGEFELRSRYIMSVVNPNAPIDAFPAGFEGYIIRDYDSGVLAPQPIYKTTYDPTSEKVKKVYLGITGNEGIDQNLFNWKGYTNDSSPNQWTASTKGFHMDSGATIAGNFEVGCCQFRTISGIEGTQYESIFARKFTFVPQLGFDGWNCYRETRTNTDRYKVGKIGFTNGLLSEEFQQISATEGTSDYYAYLEAIRTFENPESVNINVFSVTNVDYADNNDIVTETIDMIEEERADSIYLLTSPEGVVYENVSQLTGLGFTSADVSSPEDIVDFLELADIDSNYTATYWPWIQKRDNENNVNVWLPPTYEVARNLALTDNVSFPWFATAGYTRGLTDAIQARVKLTEEDRDVLYEGRINPMATFSDQGVVIWGNKNLQVRDSALDRLNVRRLLLQTRKLISAVSVRLLFEQNDQIVRNQFLNLVNPILDNIRRERGLTDFRVVLSDDPEEIDRNEMRGKIFLKPIPALEYIIIEFNVTPTGASFDDI
jgi:hypothetical protein